MIFSDQTAFPRTVTTMDLVMKPTVSVNMAGWRWEMMGIHSEGYKNWDTIFVGLDKLTVKTHLVF